MTLVLRVDVVSEAREWIGTPYVHQHRAKGHAVDCVGLVIGVARVLGLAAPDFDVTGYARTPDGRSLLAECDRFMSRVPLPEIQPGDVVVGRWGKDPQHMGIVGDHRGGLSIIHALGSADGKGQVVEHRLANNHLFKPVMGYRLPGVE